MAGFSASHRSSRGQVGLAKPNPTIREDESQVESVNDEDVDGDDDYENSDDVSGRPIESSSISSYSHYNDGSQYCIFIPGKYSALTFV
jgi:hypothetical protein